MKRPAPNHRLVKIHRTYDVFEIARLFTCHRNTVRNWLDTGLEAIDDRRPLLVRGDELVRFLQARRARHRRRCGPGELYCVKCRVPRRAAADLVDYVPITPTCGNLRGICPECGTLMHRRMRAADASHVPGVAQSATMQAAPHLEESPVPSLNCDSGRRPEDCADTQP